MPSRRPCKAAIIIALGLLPTASFAVCVDFDGGGRCIETGPAGRIPTPPPPSRVDPPPSTDRENPQQEQVKHKPPRPSTPSMKSVVTGTIVEGVFQGLFSPPARQAKPPGKAVTSVTSPGAGEIQRQFQGKRGGCCQGAGGAVPAADPPPGNRVQAGDRRQGGHLRLRL